MERKRSIVKPLLILILLTLIIVEFIFFSLFYDLNFDFIVYPTAPEYRISSSVPLCQSPAILTVLKHECFFARVEVSISCEIDSEVILSFLDGRVVNLTGTSGYVLTVVLPGRFPLSGYTSLCIYDHCISTDKPVEVFLEEAWRIHPYEEDAFVLFNITVISGYAHIRVKVWGVML
jgi:hypothetical protein